MKIMPKLNKSTIFSLVLVIALFSAAALAAHTATVTFSSTQWQVNTSVPLAIEVRNTAPAGQGIITEFILELPTHDGYVPYYQIPDTIIPPTNWGVQTWQVEGNGIYKLRFYAYYVISGIIPGFSKNFTIGSTTAPTLAGNYDWLWQTKDNNTDTYNGIVTTIATPGPFDHLEITGEPTSIMAGTPFDVTISAVDIYGNPKTDYAGTVHFSSNDNQAQLPSDYTYQPADQGSHVFSIEYRTTGDRYITVSDGGSWDSDTTAVTPAALESFMLDDVEATATAGVPFDFTVTAYDEFDNLKTDYAGIVTFDSTDAQADEPTDDGSGWLNGVATFFITYKTAGDQTFTVSDNDVSEVSPVTTVSPSAAYQLVYTVAPEEMPAGTYAMFIVQVQDEFGNPVTAPENGTLVNLTTNSTSAQHGFFDAEGGNPITNVTILEDESTADFWYYETIVGIYTITSSSEPLLPAVAEIEVTVGVTATLRVTPDEATITADDTQNYTAIASDGWNVVDVTEDTNFTIDAGAGGSWAQNVYTADNTGTWTVTGTYDSIVDTATLTVNPGALNHFHVYETIPEEVIAGTPITFHVRAEDDDHNYKTDYTGTVHFTSTDAQAALPSNYTYTPADAGIHEFTVTLYTAGEQEITVTDIATGIDAMRDTTVLHSNALAITISPDDRIIPAGASIEYFAAAVDAYNNEFDVTEETTFSTDLGAGGSWVGNTYYSDITGTWTVTGTYDNLTDTTQLTVVNTVEMNLVAGWNLVSVPTELFDSDVEDVFGGNLAIEQIYTYQDGSWRYAFFVNGDLLQGNILTNVVDGQGYWVYTSDNTVVTVFLKKINPLEPPPVYSLPQGWSLIGYTTLGLEPQRQINSYLTTLGNKWELLYRYNTETEYFERATRSGEDNDFDFVDLMRGYWLYLNEGGDLAP